MKPTIPTEQEISPTNGLDLEEREAIKHFLGKSILEAEALFRENFVLYTNDLHWMGSAAFDYYFPAFATFLRSSESAGYGDAVNSLVVLLEIRMTSDVASLVSSKDELLRCLEYCIANYEKYGVNAEVYYKLRSKLSLLKLEIERAK